MQLRERTAEDLPALAAVAARVRTNDGYPAFLPRDDYTTFLTRPAPLRAWVVQIGDAIAGHVAITAETSVPVMQLIRDRGVVGDLAVVARLLVDPDHRRKGLGSLLLDRAEREAVASGRVPVLDVVSSSAAAIALYRRAGWRDIGRTSFTFPDGSSIEETVFVAAGVGVPTGVA